MWRNLASSTNSKIKRFWSVKSFLQSNLTTPPQPSSTLLNSSCPLVHSLFSPQKHNFHFPHSLSYASVAEALASTDADSDFSGSEEVQITRHPKKMVGGMGAAKFYMLKRRQIKMETEAWEQAAKEYQELLADMCEQKLAPNLPYVKSLFLGWFEPLRDAILAEQEACKENNRLSHGPYFHTLPADMMAVITMHKLVGLLMTNAGEIGSVRVVQAASQIGEAIENEGRLHRFLENTKKKKKNLTDEQLEDKVDPKEQEKLRKRVTGLIKKQKLQQVRGIVKGHDDSKPWGQEAHVKVGCRLIQLLMETAFIQPPIDQLADSPPDVRPAFMHTLKNVTKDSQ